MNTVIFDPEDLEPITVIDVPRSYFRALDADERPPILRFPILEPVRCVVDEPIAELCKLQIATIRFERFRYRDLFKWMAFAMDPEVCLLMKSVFLPGQTKALNRERAEAQTRGILHGLYLALGR